MSCHSSNLPSMHSFGAPARRGTLCPHAAYFYCQANPLSLLSKHHRYVRHTKGSRDRSTKSLCTCPGLNPSLTPTPKPQASSISPLFFGAARACPSAQVPPVPQGEDGSRTAHAACCRLHPHHACTPLGTRSPDPGPGCAAAARSTYARRAFPSKGPQASPIPLNFGFFAPPSSLGTQPPLPLLCLLTVPREMTGILCSSLPPPLNFGFLQRLEALASSLSPSLITQASAASREMKHTMQLPHPFPQPWFLEASWSLGPRPLPQEV